jgi:signal peptidase I
VAKKLRRDAAPETSDGLWGTIKTVFWAVVIAIVVRTFAYEPFNIPSGSMYPGLLVGDYLFVSKFTYGYSNYSFPFSPPIIRDRVLGSAPQRGDVVVFRLPKDPSIDYIKRVIGLPGDRIQVRDGMLHINGKPVGRKSEESVFEDRGQRLARFTETLPEGRSYTILKVNDLGAHNNTEEFVVPPGHYFMMGDNRDFSIDSRFPCPRDPQQARFAQCVGFVPAKNLVGRAEFLFFSWNGTADFWEVWKWPSAIRFGRIFDGVH